MSKTRYDILLAWRTDGPRGKPMRIHYS